MNFRAYAAEFIGTFALLFVVVGAIASKMNPLGVVLANGIVIAAMIAALGRASGAHFNPSVTLGLFLTGRISLNNSIAYWVAQLLGATLAVGLLTLALGRETMHTVAYGVPHLAAGVSPLAGLLIEIILTFFLVLVIVTTAIHLKNPAAAAYIGLAVALGVLGGANITGAAMNPARAFGSAIWGGGFAHGWVYWVGPLLGGILGTLVSDWIYRAKSPREVRDERSEEVQGSIPVQS
ncbi:MAG: aquaporin [Thermaceae bacterium]|nr:aquaporin [Thermaceae bacterium]